MGVAAKALQSSTSVPCCCRCYRMCVRCFSSIGTPIALLMSVLSLLVLVPGGGIGDLLNVVATRLVGYLTWFLFQIDFWPSSLRKLPCVGSLFGAWWQQRDEQDQPIAWPLQGFCKVLCKIVVLILVAVLMFPFSAYAQVFLYKCKEEALFCS